MNKQINHKKHNNNIRYKYQKDYKNKLMSILKLLKILKNNQKNIKKNKLKSN